MRKGRWGGWGRGRLGALAQTNRTGRQRGGLFSKPIQHKRKTACGHGFARAAYGKIYHQHQRSDDRWAPATPRFGYAGMHALTLTHPPTEQNLKYKQNVVAQSDPKAHPTQSSLPCPLPLSPRNQPNTKHHTFKQVSALVLDPLRHGRQQCRGRIPHPPRSRPPRHELKRVEARPHVEMRSVGEPSKGIRVHDKPLRRADGLCIRQ